MSEPGHPEVATHQESPKPGSLATVQERINTAYIGNILKSTDLALDERTRKSAESLAKMQDWQVGMLESLVNEKAYEEVDATGSFDSDAVRQEMTAVEAAQRLDRWLQEFQADPKREERARGISVAEVQKYADDLYSKLIDESSRTPSSD